MTFSAASPEPQQGSRTRRTLRRRHVPVPDAERSTDALFLVLRRMRAPLILVVVVFAVSVAGLCLIPGVDDQGNPWHMSPFDALYLMSYTATTIGFGEIPYALTRPQRLWMLVCIIASVVGWAYSVGALFALVQERGFREALGRQRFVRQVRRMRRPFLVLVGYGQMGRAAAETLDRLGRSIVVVVNDQESMDALAGANLRGDIPALLGDARDPAVLGSAGLGSRYCAGVLALTDDDAVNLSIVMAVTLLRHDLPVIARGNDRAVTKGMREFGAEAVVNPFERYGNYLVMRLRRPSTYRLVTWLMAPPGEPVAPEAEEHKDGPWVIASDDHFGAEIALDLEDAGLDTTVVWPVDGAPDVSRAAGFIAGGSDDAANLALAGHARLVNPDVFLTVRQRSRQNEPLLRAFAPDSVFIPAQLTTQEALAQVITPDFWQVVSHCWSLSEDEAEALLNRLVDLVGTGSPDSHRIVVNDHDAPAVARWVTRHPMTLDDLFRHPDDRESRVAALPMMMIRNGAPLHMPDPATEIRDGDVILAVGRPHAFSTLEQALFYDHVVEYLATGEQVPATWLFRMMRRERPTSTGRA